MAQAASFSPELVRAVYEGAEGDLWRLIMGEQIHVGGLASSLALAGRAGLARGARGVDLCCCNGAGMRFLVRLAGAAAMTGVDFTPHVITQGRRLCLEEGLAGAIEFIEADVRQTGLPTGGFDFAWGEDAWCYVAEKPRLIAEAVRLVRPGGTLAFTDWVAGPTPMSGEEMERFLAFMKFPDVESVAGYRALLEENGCTVLATEDTGRFAPCVELYINMLENQLGYDALKRIGFDLELMQGLGAQMRWMLELARAGKVAQGLFVARKGE